MNATKCDERVIVGLIQLPLRALHKIKRGLVKKDERLLIGSSIVWKKDGKC